MLYLVELGILAVTICVAWWIFRQKTADNFVVLATYLAALPASPPAWFISGFIVSAMTRNLVLKYAVPTLISTAAYSGTYWLLKYEVNRDGRAIVRRLDEAMHLPLWLDRVFRAGFFSMYLAAVALCVFIFVNALAAASADWDARFRTRSLVLRYMLPENDPAFSTTSSSPSHSELSNTGHGTAGPGGSASGGNATDPIAVQNQFLFRFRKGWFEARDTIAEKTGVAAIRDYLEAIRELSNLPQEEYEWLVEVNPPLKRLVNYPPLIHIVENDEIMALIDDIAAGSLTAVYTLGDRPEIQALIDDPMMRDAIQSLSPLALRDQIRDRREAGSRFKAAWAVTERDSMLQLRAALADYADGGAGRWRTVPSSQPVIQWTGTGRVGVAITMLTPSKSTGVEARFYTDAVVLVRLGTRVVPCERKKGYYACRFDLPAAGALMTLAADFRGSDDAMRCVVELYRRKP